MDQLDKIKTVLELISTVITILGVPGAIYIFIREARKDRREKEKEREENEKERESKEYLVYNSLDDKYVDFLKLCLEHSDLNISHFDPDVRLTAKQEYRQIKIFEILVSLFERAYLLYKNQSSQIKREQWSGWSGYIETWVKNKNFQNAWEVLGSQWDEQFSEYMNDLVNSNTSSSKK